MEVFSEGALTVRALSKRSGVSVGSIYHHFGTLDGVRAAVYEGAMSDLLDTLLARLEGVEEPKEGVEALVRTYLRWSIDHPLEALFIHGAVADPFKEPFAEGLQQSKAPRIAALFGHMAPWVESGQIVPLPPHIYEMLLIGPSAEVVRRWLGGAPLESVHEAARCLPERIWAALRGSTS